MTATIILAAGASRRLGRAKQTLTYKDQSLLRHAINAALEADTGPVIVVTGANRTDVEMQIESERVTVFRNDDYDQGIASSITSGVTHALAIYEQCNNIILMVCDQPFVDKEILRALVNTKATTGKPIVASAYMTPSVYRRCLINNSFPNYWS
jgi:molybdenum cofactor cytidylyltransferase